MHMLAGAFAYIYRSIMQYGCLTGEKEESAPLQLLQLQ